MKLSDLTATLNSDVWNLRTRVFFWITCLLTGGCLCYVTRYYINGDAIAYLDMGEALRNGTWWGLANLTYSPGYPILLGIAQALFRTDPTNDVVILKAVTFFTYVLAMAACDCIINRVIRELRPLAQDSHRPLPFMALGTLGYTLFMVASLDLIKLRLINPDQLMSFLVLITVVVILWIRDDPNQYRKYALLGICFGLGYISKSWFLVFTPVFVGTALLVSGPLKRSLPRLAVAAVVMALVTAPLVGALSYRVGRFSYGELSRFAYTYYIAGQGELTHAPKLLNRQPDVRYYDYSIPCSTPAGFDICYWYQGLRPKMDLSKHSKLILDNVIEALTGVPPLIPIFLWFLFQFQMGSFRPGRLFPPSPIAVLLLLGILGPMFFCSIHFESRYAAAFIFLGALGLAAAFRYPSSVLKSGAGVTVGVWLLVAVLGGITVNSVADQSLRSWTSKPGKPSYYEAYAEQLRIKDFFGQKGVVEGDQVAVLGDNMPLYWARMSGVTVTAEVGDRREFLAVPAEARKAATDAMAKAGVKALVGKGADLPSLSDEKWVHVPGTDDFYLLFL